MNKLFYIIILVCFSATLMKAGVFKFPGFPELITMSSDFYDTKILLDIDHINYSYDDKSEEKIIEATINSDYLIKFKNVKLHFTKNKLSRIDIFLNTEHQFEIIELLNSQANCLNQLQAGPLPDSTFLIKYTMAKVDEVMKNSKLTYDEQLLQLKLIGTYLKFNIFIYDDCQVSMRCFDPNIRKEGLLLIKNVTIQCK